jgi:replicative DNA helicase
VARKRETGSPSVAELAVIGAAVVDPVAAADALRVMRPSDCRCHAHELILEAVEDLLRQSEPLDEITVGARLESWGQLTTVGGVSYLSRLTDQVPDVTSAGHYARLVRCESLRRRLEQLAKDAQDVAESGVAGADLDAALGRVYASVGDLVRQATTGRGGPQAVVEVARDVMEVATTIAASGAASVGVASGIVGLDGVLGGMRAGGLYLLGATTSVGKTALALQVADQAATDGSTVLFFSLEMSAQQLVQRVLAGRTGVSCHLMVNGRLSDYARDRLESAIEWLPKGLLIDDSGSLTMAEIAARSRSLAIGGRVDLVVVDYLGLVAPTARGRSREEEVSEVSRGLKNLAKELGVPVLALAQLNRAADHAEHGPQLYHLRESGRLEQDADVVLFLHRPEKGNAAELRVAKNRQGPAGVTVRLRFDGVTTRFSEVTTALGDSSVEPEDDGGWYGRD